MNKLTELLFTLRLLVFVKWKAFIIASLNSRRKPKENSVDSLRFFCGVVVVY